MIDTQSMSILSGSFTLCAFSEIIVTVNSSQSKAREDVGVITKMKF